MAIFCVFTSSAFATAPLPPVTTFYVDADWTGSQSGTSAQPWSNLTSTLLKTTIPAALSNGPVTIYFNSREQGTNTGVDLTYAPSTAFGTYLLTFDGSSFYHKNESSTNWLAETNPTNLANILYISSEDVNHMKRSLVTLHGMYVSTPGFGSCAKAISIAGDNWIVECCNITVQPGASAGPTVLLVPTADGNHGGSSEYTPPCTNIIIRTNIIHDTFGEGLYLGGGGNFTNWYDVGAGYPSHSYVWVQGNTIYNTAYNGRTGSGGGQGDGIDTKGGINYLTIEGNNIYAVNDPNDLGTRPIVMEGMTNGANQVRIIRNNFIHDCLGASDAGISVGNSWGVVQGLQIYNNVIVNLTGGGLYGTNGYSPNGIKVSQSQDPVQIFNNTIYNCQSSGVQAVATNAPLFLTNNLIWGNNTNGTGPQVAYKNGDPISSDYNAYVGTWGWLGEGSHSMSLSTSQMAQTVVNPPTENFEILLGAPIVGMGMPLSSLFSFDFAGNLRGASWTMGAYGYILPPLPPTGLHTVPN